MKKVKYRNNNYNNQIYSINYKFDSVSPAGKFCGTALDLIKKYNELAKEAHANGNYVESEVFRQYAEHYRKIVTEINERKNIKYNAKETSQNNDNGADSSDLEENKKDNIENNSNPDSEIEDTKKENTLVETKAKSVNKSFKIIEVSDKNSTTKKSTKQKTKKNENAAVNG